MVVNGVGELRQKERIKIKSLEAGEFLFVLLLFQPGFGLALVDRQLPPLPLEGPHLQFYYFIYRLLSRPVYLFVAHLQHRTTLLFRPPTHNHFPLCQLPLPAACLPASLWN